MVTGDRTPQEEPMRKISGTVLLAVLAGCSSEEQVTQPMEVSAQLGHLPRYEIRMDTMSLGGTASRGTAINNQGLVAGFSNLPGNLIRHAVLWEDGSIVDLGTLGGPNSSVVWPGLNDVGMVVGIAETGALDPLGEEWSCTAFFATITGHICVGFAWEDGVMYPLPTLGGNQGFATAVNGRGQVVGWAETPVHDPTCNSPQVLQFRAVLWEPKNNTTQELPPFPGDSTSAATAINGKGQVVGISGDCDIAVGRFSARHAVLWDNGTVTELPNLGGTTWHTPMDINDAGDVVGFSNPAGPGDPAGDFISHAFLWTRGSATAQDLGTLSGDAFSEAFAINARGQIVGISPARSGSRAFLYQDGVMLDFNTLVGPGNLDVFQSAQDINDAGQITGRVRDHVSGKVFMFVATPVAATP
jgi:probable HAF family extracellular repeat protein